MPSGEPWFLRQGADRELLLPEEHQRPSPWTARVWPGALFVEGEIVGTWRRAGHVVMIQRWHRLSRGKRNAVEAQGRSLPLAGMDRSVDVRWVRSQGIVRTTGASTLSVLPG